MGDMDYGVVCALHTPPRFINPRAYKKRFATPQIHVSAMG